MNKKNEGGNRHSNQWGEALVGHNIPHRTEARNTDKEGFTEEQREWFVEVVLGATSKPFLMLPSEAEPFLLAGHYRPVETRNKDYAAAYDAVKKAFSERRAKTLITELWAISNVVEVGLLVGLLGFFEEQMGTKKEVKEAA